MIVKPLLPACSMAGSHGRRAVVLYLNTSIANCRPRKTEALSRVSDKAESSFGLTAPPQHENMGPHGLYVCSPPLFNISSSTIKSIMSFLSPCRAALLQSSRRASRVSTANRSLLATQWYQQRNASTKHPKGFAPPTQDDLEELRERTVEFARREIPQDVAQAVDHTNEFPNDMWKKMGEAGFLGITADEDYGGLAMGYQAHCTVMEELSRASG